MGYFCSIVLLITAPGEVALDQVTHGGCQCGRDEGEGCEDVGCELHSVFWNLGRVEEGTIGFFYQFKIERKD